MNPQDLIAAAAPGNEAENIDEGEVAKDVAVVVVPQEGDLVELPDERVNGRYLHSRNTTKEEKDLEEAAAVLPDWEGEVDLTTVDRDEPVQYKQVTMKGELFSQHPEDRHNPTFNKQVSEESLAKLWEQLSGRSRVEAILLLPENDFNVEETIKYTKKIIHKETDIRLKCASRGCLRRQDRMFGRVLHGLYPNVRLEDFEHKQTTTAPMCYYVNTYRRSPLAHKFKDASGLINRINDYRSTAQAKL